MMVWLLLGDGDSVNNITTATQNSCAAAINSKYKGDTNENMAFRYI